MDRSTGIRALSVALLIVLFTFLTAANFIPKDQRVESDFWPDDGLRLGLDLRGGIHWVVGVEIDDAITRELEFLRKTLEDQLEREDVRLAETIVEQGQLRLTLAKETDRSKTLEVADETTVLESVGSDGPILTYQLTEDWTQDVRERTMSQVLEVLRRRIDDPQRGIPDSVS